MQNADFENSWSAQINSFLSYSDMELLRASQSRRGRRDRTGTRAANGNVQIRWSEGLENARAIPSLQTALPAKSRVFAA